MSVQLDLFVELAPKPWKPEDDYPGWQARILEDLKAGPLVMCFPGFMGAMAERLVARGLVASEPAGFLPNAADSPQFRYSLRAAA